MTRRRVGGEVVPKVMAYLLKAETLSAEQMPITYQAIAAVTGYDWRTIKKYMGEEIELAVKAQEGAGRSARQKEEDAYAERLQELRDQIADLKKKNEGLLARMILMEGNARRLGIDPDDLYAPLKKPDRSVSRAGRGRGPRRR